MERAACRVVPRRICLPRQPDMRPHAGRLPVPVPRGHQVCRPRQPAARRGRGPALCLRARRRVLRRGGAFRAGHLVACRV
ncbi:hypothetical protein VHUM_02211 [Vanrija humicola]|uniref:Uncharacterized protein n=1 Tax=Vanrija humicola TaxID=5417 RepID=A0A7D8V1V9_VANHU|nr:hypothetical protein VHUM_02211 [Vanrija humicola]